MGQNSWRRIDIPSVFGRAQQRDAVEDSVAYADFGLSADGQMVLYYGDFLAQQGRAGIVATEVAVEADDAEAVGGMVPNHRDGGLVVGADDFTAFDIPGILVARGRQSIISYFAAFADRAIAAEVKNFATKDFYLVFVGSGASAVVEDLVDDVFVVGDVLDDEIRCGSRLS